MTAKCTFCSSGDPFGTCYKCSSWACDQHGRRHPSKFRFVCHCCDSGSCAGSAARMVAQPASTAFRAMQEFDLIPKEDPPDFWLFESLADFEEKRPGYGEEIFAEIRSAIRDQRLKFDRIEDFSLRSDVLDRLPQEGRDLLVAAVFLILRFGIPRDQVAQPLVEFVNVWE